MELQPIKPRRKHLARTLILGTGCLQKCALLAPVLLVALLLVCILLGGFKRPAPASRAEFIQRYMQPFDEREIKAVDYVFRGGMRGACILGRVQFKGPVRVLGGAELRSYDPDLIVKEFGPLGFKDHLTIASEGKVPPWLDFPFEQRMRALREIRKICDQEGCPSDVYEWYIDDQRRVVYVWAMTN